MNLISGPALVFSFFAGALADKYGCKRFLLIPVIGKVVSDIGMIINYTFPLTLATGIWLITCFHVSRKFYINFCPLVLDILFVFISCDIILIFRTRLNQKSILKSHELIIKKENK